jgi:hypothetical protein
MLAPKIFAIVYEALKNIGNTIEPDGIDDANDLTN